MAYDEDGRVELERVMYRMLSDVPAGIRFYELVRQVRQATGERVPVATLRGVLHDLLTDGVVERVAQGTYRAAPVVDFDATA